MLQDILDSRQEAAALSFFLVAPERSFSIFEIAKRLALSRQATSRSLSVLTEAGLLKVFTKRGKKYYLANSRHPLLPEIRRQFVKEAPSYQDELFAAIRRLGQVKAAFLSGIFTAQPSLPVDLLLVGKIHLRRLSDFLKVAEKLMGQEINYSIMSVQEFQLRRDTFDKFIKDIFDYPHLVVCDELAKKKK